MIRSAHNLKVIKNRYQATGLFNTQNNTTMKLLLQTIFFLLLQTIVFLGLYYYPLATNATSVEFPSPGLAVEDEEPSHGSMRTRGLQKAKAPATGTPPPPPTTTTATTTTATNTTTLYNYTGGVFKDFTLNNIPPVGSNTCANVDTIKQQAAWIKGGVNYKTCRHSSDCRTARGTDCCAKSYCACLPLNNTLKRGYCVFP
jgi:hypothetical protein